MQSVNAQVLPVPVSVDADEWESYFPKFVDSYDASKLTTTMQKRYGTMSITIKTTDPLTPYNESHAVVNVDNSEISPFEIHGFKNFDIQWIDKESLAFDIWPGRCLQLQAKVLLDSETVVGRVALNHCGVTTRET